MSSKVGTPKLALWAALVATLAMTPSARAHEDPPGCFETGPAIIVSVFRANGTTGVVGSVSECETINYRATLQKASSSDTICAFAEGTFRLTTPDGVVHDINLDVPCIGGTTGEGCDPTVTQLQSNLIPYTVDPADIVGGFVVATAVYANGVAHDTESNTAGVGANTPKSTPVTLCPDTDPCTIDACDPNVAGSAACSNTPIVCDDNTVCTTDQCVGGFCVFTPISCDDNNVCTTDTCDAVTGCASTPIVCNDDDPCTTDDCNPVTGCFFTPGALDCNDNDVCTSDACVPGFGCVNTPGALDCDDNDPCTTDRCDPVQGCVNTPGALDCNDNDPCTSDACVTGVGCVNTPGALDCDDNDICTDDRCDPTTGCVNTPDPSNDPSCAPVGCRLTGGGITPDGGIDLGEFASISAAHHGGQVGASCGCIGCFDEFDHVQGNWVHQRKKQKSNFKADDFNSLICGCDGVFDGKLCNPDDRDLGPEPRPAPANMACFSGRGTLKRNGRTTEVAFRVEIEDRGEPGAGPNSSPTDDVYRMRIWVPKGQETVASLAAGACCTNPEPAGDADRNPEIDDGGNIETGNLQIHPQIASHIGECPVPDGSCTE
jgi:hypothetical protein